MRVPCCWWCYREMEIQPAQEDPKPGRPMRFAPMGFCNFCGSATWAGLFVDEDTREGTYDAGRPAVHRGEGLQGLRGSDPMGGDEEGETDGCDSEP